MLKSLLHLPMALIVIATVLGIHAFALPTQVVHVDTPQCDPLFIPTNVHEIGDAGVFPSDESLFAISQAPQQIGPCAATDDPTALDEIVEIRNLSGRPWLEVWYVANPETTITNFDGEANDIAYGPTEEAFRIDNMISDPNGSHHPLLFESMTLDGIWEPLETWRFVLQDYSNAFGVPASAIDSLGVGDASPPGAAGFRTSSGSIIGVTIPEPKTCVLLLMGLSTFAFRRR